ncbi:TonB-like protein [Idiomarina fontislapidosi]|uniref:TonB C-terminal domain-containing protein n=1 Tax=Idiomarina fontislapidosi TaxID=263723 RepID=A0A432Y9T7_9GAMM|nr:hypothetical protein [Idiomarina fontislapidosi]PYE34296.1 TonB-like protein [Idiomarina fontislapidosi]RUO57740.1 hypothetical protein CWE25_04535 [Idiomarina fontislapidosi]
MKKLAFGLTGAICLLGLIGCESMGRDLPEEPEYVLDLTEEKNGQVVTDYWVMQKQEKTRNTSDKYARELARNNQNGCASIIYTINSEGRVPNYKVEYAYPNETVAKAIAVNLHYFRFKPTEQNVERTPVMTRMFSVFKVGKSEGSEEFKAACDVDANTVDKFAKQKEAS